MPPRKYPNRRDRQSAKDFQPETYDDLMEAAVEAEEKGERFGAGPKAQRYFESSLDLYRRADLLSASFDSRYNIARVLYQLGTNFTIPPQAAQVLSSSIEAYRSAIAMSKETDLSSDASFNLAQALLDLAEMTEMFSSDESAQNTSLPLRLEAVQLLDAVLRFERESLQSEVETEDDQSLESMTAGGDSPAGHDSAVVTEKHVPTKRSCLDTALLLADAQTDVWSDQSAPPTATDVKALGELLNEAKSLTADATEQIEVLLAEIDGELVLEALEWQLDANVHQSVQKLSDLLARLERSTSTIVSSLPTKTQVDVSLSRADLHGLLAARLMGLHIDQGNVATAWSQLSQAINLLNLALQLPISPIDMPLAKPLLLLDLSSLSLRRAALSQTGHEIALRSRSQLLVNAEVYANKSLAAGGWGWLCSEAVDVGIVGATSVTVPQAAGYIKEDLMERALATLVRGLMIREQCDESVREATQSKLTLITSKITQMKAARGRHLDPTRLSKYFEEIQREQGQVWKDELELWQSYASSLTL